MSELRWTIFIIGALVILAIYVQGRYFGRRRQVEAADVRADDLDVEMPAGPIEPHLRLDTAPTMAQADRRQDAIEPYVQLEDAPRLAADERNPGVIASPLPGVVEIPPASPMTQASAEAVESHLHLQAAPSTEADQTPPNPIEPPPDPNAMPAYFNWLPPTSGYGQSAGGFYLPPIHPEPGQEHQPAVISQSASPILPAMEDDPSMQATPADVRQQAEAGTMGLIAEVTPAAAEILTIYLMAWPDTQFRISEIRRQVQRLGLALSAEGVFLRKNGEEEIYRIVNVMEPGVFDTDRLPALETPGIAIRTVLPTSRMMRLVVREMYEVANILAEELGGEVLDEQQQALTSERFEWLLRQLRVLEVTQETDQP